MKVNPYRDNIFCPENIGGLLFLRGIYINPLSAKKKMHLKMLSAEVVCCKLLPNITDELSIEANSVDPEQTASIGAV